MAQDGANFGARPQRSPLTMGCGAGSFHTIACIAGGLAHAFFGSLPPEIEQAGLDERLLGIVREFAGRYWPVV
jgi:hypothetical protein